MKLGQILVQKRLISSDQLKQAMHLQVFGRKKLGEILISQGAIQPEELQQALEEQRSQPYPNPQPFYRQKILKWNQVGNTYKAVYQDELGTLIFVIKSEKTSYLFQDKIYQLSYQYQLANETLFSDTYCGCRETLLEAQQLAECQLRQLL